MATSPLVDQHDGVSGLTPSPHPPARPVSPGGDPAPRRGSPELDGQDCHRSNPPGLDPPESWRNFIISRLEIQGLSESVALRTAEQGVRASTSASKANAWARFSSWSQNQCGRPALIVRSSSPAHHQLSACVLPTLTKLTPWLAQNGGTLAPRAAERQHRNKRPARAAN